MASWGTLPNTLPDATCSWSRHCGYRHELNHLLRQLAARAPASLRACALLDERPSCLVELALDDVGFAIPDEFVVGYGLDYQQRFRNLPFIAMLRTEAPLDSAASGPDIVR